MSAEFDGWRESQKKLEAARKELRGIVKNLSDALDSLRRLPELELWFHHVRKPALRIPSVDEICKAIEELFSAHQAEDGAYNGIPPDEKRSVRRE
jgi:hypothetical protein